LRDIVKRGGDTSANAIVVGGLIGALCGVNQIDNDKINAAREVIDSH